MDLLARVHRVDLLVRFIGNMDLLARVHRVDLLARVHREYGPFG
jgi:hypothetical protein